MSKLVLIFFLSLASKFGQQQSQTDVATTIEQVAYNLIDAMTVTITSKCLNDAYGHASLDKKWCRAFCYHDEQEVVFYLDLILKALHKPFCGADFNNVLIGEFEIPVLVPNYNGSCYFTGKNAKLSISISSYKIFDFGMINIPSYNFTVTAFINWKGDYSVVCVPYVLPPFLNSCNQDLKFVFDSIGLLVGNKINITNPNAEKAFSDKVEIQEFVDDGFQYNFYTNTTIELAYAFGIVTSNFTINLGNNVPSKYVQQVKEGIISILKTYYFQYAIQKGIEYPISETFTRYFKPKCPTCIRECSHPGC